MIEIQANTNIGQAKILVLGVGGCGNNALTRMTEYGVEGVELIAVNTDVQDLNKCMCNKKLQIGEKLTKGLGAGSIPEVGEKAAQESSEEIENAIKDADMVIITCGMGGGTGTGAAPYIAGLSKNSEKLTVAVVTKPFRHEGKPRMRNALEGIDKLKENVDTILIVPNDKLLNLADKNISVADGYRKADEVLIQTVMGITDLIYKVQDVNVDFADLRTAMTGKGVAHIGIGIGRGDDKAKNAVEAAVNSPLLETSIEGASDLVVNISGDCTFMEATQALEHLESIVGEDTRICHGISSEVEQQGEMKVFIIATGITTTKAIENVNNGMPTANRVTPGFTAVNPNFSSVNSNVNYMNNRNPVAEFQMPPIFKTDLFKNQSNNDNASSVSTYMQSNALNMDTIYNKNNQLNQGIKVEIADFVRGKREMESEEENKN